MKNKSIRSNCLLLLTALIWGFSFVAQSVGMDYVGPYTFNFVRNLIGAAALLIFLPILDRIRFKNAQGHYEAPESYGGKLLWLGGISCGVLLAVATSFQQIGIMQTSVGKAGFITAMYIVIVPVLGLFLGKKLRIVSVISVLVAVGGMYLLCMSGGFTMNTGDIYILICAFGFALQIIFVDYFSPRVDGVRMSLIQFVTCGIICGVPALISEHPTLTAITAAWQPILYAGILSCAVAYTLQIVAQKDTDPVIASLLMSFESVFSVLGGWLLLHQSLSLKELAGCALMFAAIIMDQLPEKNKEQVHTK